jgi:hypothetical protein
VINLPPPLFYITSCSLASCASTNFLQNNALAFPYACPFHVPKMPNGGHVMHRETQYVNQALGENRRKFSKNRRKFRKIFKNP